MKTKGILTGMRGDGYKWRGLPKRFGILHTVYTRMNQWSKSGSLDRVCEKLQLDQIVGIRIEAFSLDSAAVKVHPVGTGALKRRTPVNRQVSWRMDCRDSYGCCGCSDRNSVRSLFGQGP